MSTRGIFQFGVCAAASLAVHGALFGLGDLSAGAVAAGVNGGDEISIEASDSTLAAMIDAFDAAQLAPPEPVLPPAPPVVETPAPIVTEIIAPAPLPVLAEVPPIPQAEAIKPTPKPQKIPPKAPPKKAAPKAPPKASAPAKRPSGSTSPSTTKRASGSGGGAYAGNKGTADGATLSKKKINDLRASWGATIRSRVERRKVFPAAAGRGSGQVVVRLTIAANGALSGVSVAKSSGNPAFDQAALAAVQRAGKFPAAPKGLTGASHSFTLPISFKR